MRFVILATIFFVLVTCVGARGSDSPVFTDLMKDMHQQVTKWKLSLKKMEKDPTISEPEKIVIKTLRNLLERLDGVLKEYLPPEPKVKKTRSFRQRVLRYASPSFLPVPPLTG